jgi:hypothetical protein
MSSGTRFANPSKRVFSCCASLAIVFALAANLAAADTKTPSDCEKAGTRACLALALDALGGSARLQGVKSMSFESVGHTLLVEQSYRQDPFISSYQRSNVQFDVAGSRIRVESQLTWPESDPGQSEVRATMVADATGCVMKQAAKDAAERAPDSPCSLGQIDWVRDVFSLNPLQLLTTAQQASDLHFESAQMLRSTSHAVLAFAWNGTPVRILINRFNNLPDAIETVGQFHDFWYPWGDVQRRIYLDNWVTVHGIRYPSNQIEVRNGILWKSTQVLNLKFNQPLDSADFQMDTAVATRGAQSKGWERTFDPKAGVDLAPGINFFAGAWNATLVKQDDGVVILEAPISGTYGAGVLAEAKKRYPDLPVKAVLSTSDSWPHVSGVRQAVASKLPVYILDLNQPLLDRMVAAKHSLNPDLLATTPQRPQWKIVSQKTVVGTGANRMELYPLRGASTERQYMVYFPQHRLLYASDTLALNDDGSLYDPELMREVMEAVQRENLEVDTVFAMHQGPTPWKTVADLVGKALS